jgi:hypothetical protein
MVWRRLRGSNPRGSCPPTRFPGVCLRPLGQASAGQSSQARRPPATRRRPANQASSLSLPRGASTVGRAWAGVLRRSRTSSAWVRRPSAVGLVGHAAGRRRLEGEGSCQPDGHPQLAPVVDGAGEGGRRRPGLSRRRGGQAAGLGRMDSASTSLGGDAVGGSVRGCPARTRACSRAAPARAAVPAAPAAVAEARARSSSAAASSGWPAPSRARPTSSGPIDSYSTQPLSRAPAAPRPAGPVTRRQVPRSRWIPASTKSTSSTSLRDPPVISVRRAADSCRPARDGFP